MKITFESRGGFDNTESWLKKYSNESFKSLLETYGKQGVEALARNTPKDTGETALGWQYKISQNGHNSWELNFYNTAHPELSVNLAKLIQLGHGTRTGGYVPPTDYITPSMEPIYKKVGDDLVRRFNL